MKQLTLKLENIRELLDAGEDGLQRELLLALGRGRSGGGGRRRFLRRLVVLELDNQRADGLGDDIRTLTGDREGDHKAIL